MNRTRRDGIGTCAQGHSFEYMVVHNGFNDTAYAYCDHCGMTAFVGSYGDDKMPAGAPLKLHQPILSETEDWLEPCPCGGQFRSNASPRCPSCHERLSAEKSTEWIEANAAGTRKGWRWQRSWSGVYSIVIAGRMVENNWRREPKVG